jgi:beta-galactosidase/beta-glucuronidase
MNPVDFPLRTPWEPDQSCPLPEYPRPQMTRPGWMNLNGWWQYAILPKDQAKPEAYQGQILVPYALESLLSGVQRALLPDQTLWYRRVFQDPRPSMQPQDSTGECRMLLHFGAVDYECRVWVNGFEVGRHRGGYLPFSFDITNALSGGQNELVVAVCDPTDTGRQQRGKQVLHPKSIWYTAVSGIWQTVWLERVPAVYIESLRLTPDLDSQMLAVEVQVRGAGESVQVEVEVYSDQEMIVTARGDASAEVRLPVPYPRVWSPQDPYLYDLRIRLLSQSRVVDEVGSYFAMRKFGLDRDKAGHLRFMLNNHPLFLYGPLDQGYFPDGLYTPPSEEAMLFDIEFAKRIGCNMIRKHVKVEPLRWYFHCDHLGMIVWQDMPNGGLIDGDVVAVLSLLFGFHRNDTRGLSRFGRAEEPNRAEFRTELQGMIDTLGNTACIAVWVPFNESWGQFNSAEIARWVKQYDPTRLVDHASGWFDQDGGDFQSKHVYVKKLKRPRPDQRAFALSEFGGYSLKKPGHLWDENKRFGYRYYDSSQELTAAYLSLLENELVPLIQQGLAAAIYTQTTDVEIEINGYLTYDRKVVKMDVEQISPVHERLCAVLAEKIIAKKITPPEVAGSKLLRKFSSGYSTRRDCGFPARNLSVLRPIVLRAVWLCSPSMGVRLRLFH